MCHAYWIKQGGLKVEREEDLREQMHLYLNKELCDGCPGLLGPGGELGTADYEKSQKAK